MEGQEIKIKIKKLSIKIINKIYMGHQKISIEYHKFLLMLNGRDGQTIAKNARQYIFICPCNCVKIIFDILISCKVSKFF